jgi:hypothetical protein
MELGNQDDFIDPIYLPEGIRLTQFHHFRKDDANMLLQHWTTRKDAGAVVFRFKSTARAAYRGKRAPARAGGAEIEEDIDSPENDGEKLSDEEQSDKSEDDSAGNARSVSWLPKLGGRY